MAKHRYIEVRLKPWKDLLVLERYEVGKLKKKEMEREFEKMERKYAGAELQMAYVEQNYSIPCFKRDYNELKAEQTKWQS